MIMKIRPFEQEIIKNIYKHKEIIKLLQELEVERLPNRIRLKKIRSIRNFLNIPKNKTLIFIGDKLYVYTQNINTVNVQIYDT